MVSLFGGLPRILRQDLPEFHFAASVYACLDEDGNGPGLDLRRGQDAEPEGLSLRIELRNDAKFRRNAIEAAQALVNGIYADTGVHLVWTNQDPQLTVVLKRQASAEITHRAQDAMGLTPGTDDVRGRIAFVLIDRVNEVADGYRVSPFVVLGAAIAHELGHLLTSKEHHVTGIMQPYLNQSDFRSAREGRLLFTSEQVEAIRQRAKMLVTP